MKVYACPEEFPVPELDYKNFDYGAYEKQLSEHTKKLEEFFRSKGYTGRNTGKVLSMPYADGYAQYMLLDGNPSCLIHLPYGDAWHDRNVEFLPKAEVLKRIASSEAIKAIFEKNKGK